ncbi:hypothetical protein HPB49_001329 [Dermacentor silvarum]|uniref:Uncharacterized protein n=1 Tax=Dermacentor silvarum TaxID=543639 RepID=A0ACB8D1Y9_DERSI|nr:hypothetical protein HPB49_001329 [Dermacentor silvarum]
MRHPMTVKTISYRTLTSDDILFYTGIPVAVFDKLVSALKTQDKTVCKVLTIEDQLLLTLMRLRLGLLCGDLARRFEVSVAYISRTFSRVLDDLVKIMQEVVVWLPRSRLRANMPESFRNWDEIMADRGFKLDPHLEVQGIKMNRPEFTKGKDQLPESEVTETRRIASLQIHVEREINRIKSDYLAGVPDTSPCCPRLLIYGLRGSNIRVEVHKVFVNIVTKHLANPATLHKIVGV